MKKNLNIYLVIAVYIFGFLPDMLTFIPDLPDFLTEGILIGGGLRAVDIFLILMSVSVVLKIFRQENRNFRNKINKVVLFLFLWLIFEIVRNIFQYGLSAFGEFRFRYFYFVIPIYIVEFFETEDERERLIKLLITLTVFVPLCAIPFIGFFKGWTFGEQDRFLNAQTYLGIVYGFTLYIFRNKEKYMKVILLSLPIIFMLIIDSHRSAWMAAFIVFVTLVYLKEIRLNKFIFNIVLLVGFVGLLYSLLANYGFDLFGYISKRSVAFIDPAKDSTSFWRLMVWQANIEKFLENPILGEGFGGHFYFYAPILGLITVSPHNYYIQSLVKLGIIGTIIYLYLVVLIYKEMRTWQKNNSNDNERDLVILGIAVLFASHAFYFVYSLEYMTMFFIGLSLSVVINKRKLELEVE